MKNYTITIPVKPHVHKFLKRQFGEPYKVTEKDFIGLTLTCLLRRPENHSKCEELINEYSSGWKIELNQKSIDRGAYHLGTQNISAFNTSVTQMMKMMLAEEVMENSEQYGAQKKKVILNFMARYSILESELSFDALKKAVQRKTAKSA